MRQEVIDFIRALELDNTQDLTLIDLGCRTGATAIHASKYFRKLCGGCIGGYDSASRQEGVKRKDFEYCVYSRGLPVL